MLTIIDAIKQHAGITPYAIAVQDDTQKLNYQDLWVRVQTLGNQLKDQGIRHLMLHGDNSVNWVVVDLACYYANVTCIPIPVFFSKSQQQHLVKTVKPDLILSSRSRLVNADIYYQLEHISFEGYHCYICKQPKKERYSSIKITFTSGTTGKPNGVHVSQQQITTVLNSLNNIAPIQKSQHGLSLLPLSVLLENIAGVYLALFKGMTHSLPSARRRGLMGSSRLNPSIMLKCLQKTKPQALILTPALAEIIYKACVSTQLNAEDFAFLAVGSSFISQDLMQSAHQIGLPLYEGYGLSECASVVSLNTPQDLKLGSVGKLLPHIKCKIIEGELYFQGNSSPAYLNTSAEKHDNTLDAWQASGDLGFIDDDGFLYITGRKKNLIINSYGRNISPEWVEKQAEKYSAIKKLMLFGDRQISCAAFIWADSQVHNMDIQRAINKINETLPDYARISYWMRKNFSLQTHPQLFTHDGTPKRKKIEDYFFEDLHLLYTQSMSMNHGISDHSVMKNG